MFWHRQRQRTEAGASDSDRPRSSRGWRQDPFDIAPQQRGPRDRWGSGASGDQGSSRGRREGGRQGGNSWGRGGGQQWAPREAYRDKDSSPGKALRDGLQGEALYGISPVLGALQAMRRTVHALYIQEGVHLLQLSGVPIFSQQQAVHAAYPCQPAALFFSPQVL